MSPFKQHNQPLEIASPQLLLQIFAATEIANIEL